MTALPMALAITLSPFAVIPAVMLLLSDRPRSTGSAFLAGWAAGIVIITVVAVLLADVVGAFEPPSWVRWVRAAAGVLLVGYGLWSMRPSRPPGKGSPMIERLSGATPRSARRLGLTLSMANPKILVMAAAGGLSIGAEGTSIAGEAAEVLVFAVVASIGVGAPLALHLALGDRAMPPLRALGDFLDRRGDLVIGVVLVVLGGWLAYSSLT